MARKSGNLQWLRPDGEAQVTIEYVLQDMEEIGEVVQLISQVRVQQCTVEQIVHVTVPRVVEETAEGVSDLSQGMHLEAYHRLNRRCARF